MIKIYNRKTKEYEIEKVAGEKYIKWNYSSPVGMKLLELFIKKKGFSKLYGAYCDSSLSKKKIDKFIKDFDIDMSICKNSIEDFKCFNDFFVRKLSDTGRPIDKRKEALISPGDGRLLAYENIDMNNLVRVKGLTYSLGELIQNQELAKEFQGGICLILRLCPTDYHRFHFMDEGICSESKIIKGHYYSVNPIAFDKIPKLFCENKREWSLHKTENFSDILYVEVGATCVGTIVQTYTPNKRVLKGEEKGYFKFGGSTTIVFLKKGVAAIDEDILSQSKLGYETKVLMGEAIGLKL